MPLIDLAFYLDQIDQIVDTDFCPGTKAHRQTLRDLQKNLDPINTPETRRCIRRATLLLAASVLLFGLLILLALLYRLDTQQPVICVIIVLVGLCVRFGLQALYDLRDCRHLVLFDAVCRLYERMHALPPEQLQQIKAFMGAQKKVVDLEEWDEKNGLWVFRDLAYGCLQCGELSRLELDGWPVDCPHCHSEHLVLSSPEVPLTPELLHSLHELFREET